MLDTVRNMFNLKYYYIKILNTIIILLFILLLLCIWRSFLKSLIETYFIRATIVFTALCVIIFFKSMFVVQLLKC